MKRFISLFLIALMLAPMLFSCQITFPYKGKIHRYNALPQWAAQAELEEWV